MQVQPYLFFEGRCEEALEFYRTTLGAKVTMLMRVKENPEPMPPDMYPPGSEDKVMHASFTIGETTLMASDGRAQGKPVFQGFSLSLSAPTDAEAQRLFSALGDGGQVQMPLGKTFFASSFGMVADRFGVSWMIIVAP
jgi:PhnB protein